MFEGEHRKHILDLLKKLVIMGSLILASLAASAQQDILVYSGPGVGPLSLENTLNMLKQLVGDKYNVITVTPDIIIKQHWSKNTALLVMPGGGDRPYHAKLSGVGNAKIKHYVDNGGKYLGICAGAYYSADRIAFALGDENLEVTGERELKFFPGLVSGPTYSGFDHTNTNNHNGTRAAKLIWQHDQPFAQNTIVTVFYNGGGSFVDAEKYPNVQILARYMPEVLGDNAQPAAIIECTVGKGLVILSGPHFEWDPDTLDLNSAPLAKIKPALAETNTQRLVLGRYLLDRLGVNVG